jgi:hypothetical protein
MENVIYDLVYHFIDFFFLDILGRHDDDDDIKG